MISFIIITNGKKYDITIGVINSIHSTMNNNPYEIILVGDVEVFKDVKNITLIQNKELAETGNLSAMRNLGAKNASYDILAFSDDDMVYDIEWFNNFTNYYNSNKFDVYANKILMPDGERFWDRAVMFESYHSLVSYRHPKTDRHLYQTGGFMVIHKSVFNAIKYNENITYYSGEMVNEDVDFSIRLYNHGYCISFDDKNTVYHNDDKYVKFNNTIIRKEYEEHTSDFQDHLSRYEQIYNLYLNILQRAPDDDGLKTYLLNKNFSIDEIRNILLSSPEYVNSNRI